MTEGLPERQAFQSVIKYTGACSAPEWMDIEQGSVFGFNDFCKRHSSQADKFETLCHIQADLSTAPYQTKLGTSGKICYTRDFDVILLAGLTELKAQIGWIDSETVSSWEFDLAHRTF